MWRLTDISHVADWEVYEFEGLTQYFDEKKIVLNINLCFLCAWQTWTICCHVLHHCAANNHNTLP